MWCDVMSYYVMWCDVMWCLSACLPVCLSVCLSVCLHVGLCVCMCVCMCACVSVCMHACMCVCTVCRVAWHGMVWHWMAWNALPQLGSETYQRVCHKETIGGWVGCYSCLPSLLAITHIDLSSHIVTRDKYPRSWVTSFTWFTKRLAACLER